MLAAAPTATITPAGATAPTSAHPSCKPKITTWTARSRPGGSSGRASGVGAEGGRQSAVPKLKWRVLGAHDRRLPTNAVMAVAWGRPFSQRRLVSPVCTTCASVVNRSKISKKNTDLEERLSDTLLVYAYKYIYES